jgi:hypothetical protein
VTVRLGRRDALIGAGAALAAAAWRLRGARGASPAPVAGVPAAPAAEAGLRLVCLSDLNGPYGSTTYLPTVHRAVGLIPSLQPDLVLCAGDMVAGQKRGLGPARLAAMWSAFERDVLSPLRRRGCPFAPAIGNHDASSLRREGRFVFAEDRRQASRFWQPRRDSLGLRLVDGGDFPYRYALRLGPLLLLVWEASSAALPPGQAAWAEAVLSAPPARGARHRLVMGHLPLRPVGAGRDSPGEVLADAARLQALLERHGVQAYVSGHHHAWFPARLGRLDLFHLGAAGNGPRRLLGQGRPTPHTLTVLDLMAGGPIRATTLDLETLRPLDPGQLPGRLVDRRGRVLLRRPARA